VTTLEPSAVGALASSTNHEPVASAAIASPSDNASICVTGTSSCVDEWEALNDATSSNATATKDLRMSASADSFLGRDVGRILRLRWLDRKEDFAQISADFSLRGRDDESS
jgi:hypothetical protein